MFKPHYSPQMRFQHEAFNKSVRDYNEALEAEALEAARLRAAEAVQLEKEANAQLLAEAMPSERFRVVEDPLLGTPVTDTKRMRTKAKTTAHFTARLELLVAAGFKDPVHALMEIVSGYQLVENPETNQLVKAHFPKGQVPDAKTKVMAAETILSYAYPKRKSVEVSGQEGQQISFTVQADNTPIEEMPSEQDMQRMIDETRAKEREAQRTIDGRV